MTDLEKMMLVRLVRKAKMYDDCCPDVGWGPSIQMFLDRELDALELELSAAQHAEIVRMYLNIYDR